MKNLYLIIALFISLSSFGQTKTYLDGNYKPEKGGVAYVSHYQHVVDSIKAVADPNAKIRNVILLIGDGMGVSHVFAAMTANNDRLYMDQMPYIGFQKTKAKDKYRTDSAGAGSALATGKKTDYGSISVDEQHMPNATILETAAGNDYATGLVAACKITHATPAAFIAHVPKRNQYEDIATFFVSDSIDLFLGGGSDDFCKRETGPNLRPALEEKGFQIVTNIDDLADIKQGKIAGFFANGHIDAYPQRGEFLVKSTLKAIEILNQNKNGFFLMVEGSQIDWAAHDNDLGAVVEETLDFDRAVGAALKFAEKDGHTLVIVTADHETGGLSVINGDIEHGMVEGKFNTSGHSSLMVPVFAYGPGAAKFAGIYENTAIFDKMMESFDFKK
ncbi:MAG: alkaline phosphatase [Bacteroidales bacterium]|nr:alkaline phosphatase [Bacteroidales bacterium]